MFLRVYALLTIGNNKEKLCPPLECIARGRTRKDWVEGRGTSRGVTCW